MAALYQRSAPRLVPTCTSYSSSVPTPTNSVKGQRAMIRTLSNSIYLAQALTQTPQRLRHKKQAKCQTCSQSRGNCSMHTYRRMHTGRGRWEQAVCFLLRAPGEDSGSSWEGAEQGRQKWLGFGCRTLGGRPGQELGLLFPKLGLDGLQQGEWEASPHGKAGSGADT